MMVRIGSLCTSDTQWPTIGLENMWAPSPNVATYDAGVVGTYERINGPGIIGDPVAVGGVVISAGDIIVGDADGIAIIPVAHAATAPERVNEVIAKEEKMRQAIIASTTS